MQRQPLLRLALLIGSTAIAVLGLELVVFRAILPGTDIPDFAFSERGVVKYRPGQTGVFRIKDEIKSPYRINDAGWNSRRDSYLKDKTGRRRIVVIGDSYVEALQVPHNRSLAERLEDLCASACEVYRLGIGGAPMSQYLHMLRREATLYRPDWVVVVVVHNDFDESFRPARKGDERASAFLKLTMQGDRVVNEVEPSPPQMPWYDPIRRLGIYRSLWLRFGIRSAFVKPAGLLNDPTHLPEFGGVLQQMRAASLYIVEQMRSICSMTGCRPLLVMDADRRSIYARHGGNASQSRMRMSHTLNDMMTEVTQRTGADFLDLRELFEGDYARYSRPFNFVNDYHWNEYAHGLVALAIYRYITTKTP